MTRDGLLEPFRRRARLIHPDPHFTRRRTPPGGGFHMRQIKTVGFCLALGLAAPIVRGDTGARVVAEMNAPSTRTMSPTVMGDTLYFLAGDTGPTGRELYKTDGTAAGTSVVRNLNTGTLSADPGWLRPFNGALYFTAETFQSGRELYRTDGTSVGTVMVKNINTVASSSQRDHSSDAAGLTVVGSTLYFAAHNNESGNRELWKSNGTEAGTVMVTDPITALSPSDLEDYNGTLFFASGDGLFKSDGTQFGTSQVKRVREGFRAVTFPVRQLLNVNGLLLFQGDDANNMGNELWRSDGTAAGTYMLRNINLNTSIVGTTGSNPIGFVTLGDTILFAASSTPDAFPRVLYKTDGHTEAGTQLVKDVILTGGMIEFDGRMFFSGGMSGDGYELWTSDGSTDGTQRFLDINPGMDESRPQSFLEMGGLLYFTADDGSFGREIWVSDGTIDGTRRLTDINHGAGSSEARDLVDFNGALMFSAFDGVSTKLYAIPEPASLALPLLAAALLARRRRP